MRRHVLATALFLVLVLAQLFSVPSAQAAPGDFLSKWAARQYVPDAAGVAVDKEDNVYVTTTDSVQVFDSSGVLIRTWGSYGSGDGQFSFPDGIAVDPDGKVYVADSGNSRIQVFDASGNFLYKWADSDPSSIATGGESVYVLGSESIRLYDNHGTLLREFGGCDDCWGGLEDLTLTEEGLLYVFYYGDRIAITVYDGPEVIKTLGLPGMSGAITADPQGNIYIAGQQGGSGPSPLEYIRIYDSELQQIGTVYEGEMLHNSVRDMAVDSKGNIFVAGAPLRVLDSAGNPRWIHWPQSLATDKSGNVYVVGGHLTDDVINNKVEVFSSTGELRRQLTGTISETAGIAVDANNNVHVIDYGYYGCFSPIASDCRCAPRSLANAFDASGNYIRSWGMSMFAVALAIDINGRFLVAAGPGVDVYDRDGKFITSFPCPGAGDDDYYAQVRGIAVDGNGNIFVADRTSSVHVFDSSYRLLRTWGSRGTVDGQFTSPVGIAVDGMGHVFVADSANDSIQVFDEYGNFILKWGGSGDLDGRLNRPYGVVVDQAGAKVYVADQENHRIQVFEGFGVPSGPYTMSGTVRQGSEAGPVLPGATVSIAGRTATTDSTGAFSFTELAAGTYTLTISMPGYVTKTITDYVVDSDRTGQLFYLSETTYSVSGAVHEESASGAPLAGATVSIGGKTAITSSTGTFSITGIPAGTYTMTLSRTGYLTKTITGYVVDGDRSGQNVYLTRLTYSISGTVRKGNASGPIIAGATVSIAGRRGITGSDGTFTVTGIPPGTYTLYISKTGYVTKSLTGFAVNGNRSGLVFYLTPSTYTVSGTVRQGSTTGPALSGAMVSVAGKTVTTSSTGGFSIAGIPTGTYTVTISKPGFVTKTINGFPIDRNRSGLIYYLVKRQ